MKKKNRRLKEPFSLRAARAARSTARVLAFALPLPILAFGSWWAHGKLTTASYLNITGISVVGAERVGEEDVIGLSGLKEGQNLFSFSKDQVVSSLKANAWIESASIDRKLPDKVVIEITERRPAVFVKTDALYLMDARGIIFKRYSAEDEGLDLPVVTGFIPGRFGEREEEMEGRLLELISLLNSRSGFNIAGVSEISVDPAHGLSIFTLDEGVRLDVGLDGFEEKLLSFERILGTRDGVLRGIEAFDLKNHREVVVRFATDVVKRGGEANGEKG
ncbi:MAG: FtsQ-type POTRA domain-containing protein [Thermodesulfobacteriota bacterium]|nr:MAG: FtsQ-type POTRA domain-containing protein [Thermodesulfobacteriota bacterium]